MIKECDVKVTLRELSNIYPVFVSEAHLQTAFAIKLSERLNGEAFVFPEFVPLNKPKDFEDQEVHFDLLVEEKDGTNTLFEFKYKKTELKLSEEFKSSLEYPYDADIKGNQPENLGRYDCWKDIYRIESFVNYPPSKIQQGFFILITNVPKYATDSGEGTYSNGNFSITGTTPDTTPETIVHTAKEKKWPANVNINTITEARNKTLKIASDYKFNYEMYYPRLRSNDEESKQIKIDFKFYQLVVEILPKQK